MQRELVRCVEIGLSIRPWQFTNLNRPTRLKNRIARQHGLRVVETVRHHANVASKVCGYGRRVAGFSHADAVAYGAAALKKLRLLQSLYVWSPSILVVDSIVVHEKDELGHIGLPLRRTKPSWSKSGSKIWAARRSAGPSMPWLRPEATSLWLGVDAPALLCGCISEAAFRGRQGRF
jgi:hypothetical protein